jgi:hypothetical protein
MQQIPDEMKHDMQQTPDERKLRRPMKGSYDTMNYKKA